MDNFHENNIYVNEIVLKVKNLERSKKFYTEIMGFRLLEEQSSKIILTPDDKISLITLIEPEDVVQKLPNRTGLYHFALLLSSEKQLGLFLKHIRDQQYPLTGASNHGVSEAIYLQDPDDNGIEVYCDIASDQWEREGKKINMVTERLDYEKLLESVEDEKWSGIDPNTIIGHIHLHVSNLEKAKAFYVDGLGFDLTMAIDNSALFLSTANYHHHVGLNTWNGKNIDPQPTNAVGLKYFTLIFPNDQSLAATVNQLKALNYQTIDNHKDLFIEDPSNNLIKMESKK